MRLTSITVRNCRVHRELKLTLDPSRTLIGGPNSSGKSTLVEAAHRALFLRAKGNSELHRALKSTLHNGHPEVEVEFEAGGRSWQVQKRFSGASGSARLTESGGATLSGDEAEAKLRCLLGVDEEGKATGQWAHLWVWQGRAGEDPTEHANAQRDALLSRLQHEGGAAAMQSATDGRVAAAVAAQCDAIFKQNGEAKAGSELGRSQVKAAEAAEKLEAARAVAERLEQAVTEFRAAEGIIRQSGESLQKLHPQMEAVELRAARLASLRGELSGMEAKLALAAGDHQSLAKAGESVRNLRAEVNRRRESLVPGEAEAQQAAEHETACRERESEAARIYNETGERARRVRLASELAGAQAQLLERTARRKQWRAKQAEIVKERAELSAQETRLAQMPSVNAAALKKLQLLDNECATAEAVLAGMAAKLELIAGKAPVQVDGQLLAVGAACIITDDSEVTVGDGTRLRIRPGGGGSLTDARQRVQEAGAARRRALDELGLESIAQAVEAGAQRQQLEAEIKTQRARLEGMGEATVDAELARAESGAAAAAAEVERRAGAVPDVSLPDDHGAAESLAGEWRRQLHSAEAAETSARAVREAASSSLKQAAERLGNCSLAVESARRGLTDAEAQLRLLLQTHGGDEDRAAQLAARAAARDAAEQALEQTRQAIDALQPDLLYADRERLTRAVKAQMAVSAEAEQKRAGAHGLLLRDGTSDPEADLALAEARARAAAERCAAEERKARALQLLHQLFQEEQQRLADQFSAPLAAKISGYLECLFGTGARAEVRLEGHEFTGLQLVCPGQSLGAFDFETLSGGTKEQLAAAVRLAMAEVLAEAHDGCLPVVFDDAFAYADPGRVQSVQRMLDLAASRGLQVIVLTCTPADYAALGARQVLLG